jgi:hypothetical protein
MRKISIEDFIRRSSEKHNNQYDYSLIKIPLSGQDTEVDIICPQHGIFHKSVRIHLRGAGCPECARLHRKEIISNIRIKQETLEHKLSRFSKEKTILDLFNNRLNSSVIVYNTANQSHPQ